MGVSQNLGTILGAPIIRTIIFWGLYWGPLILGNYKISLFHIFRVPTASIKNNTSHVEIARRLWASGFGAYQVL